MKIINIFLLFIFSVIALASPNMVFAWTDVSFDTEVGTHIEASQRGGEIKSFSILKDGIRYTIPTSVSETIHGVDFSTIKIYELAHSDLFSVELNSDEFDQDSGFRTKTITWKLRYWHGHFDRADTEVRLVGGK